MSEYVPCEICSSNIVFNRYIEHIEICFMNRSMYQNMMTTFMYSNDDDDIGTTTSFENDIYLNIEYGLESMLNAYMHNESSWNSIITLLPTLFTQSNDYEFNLQLQEMAGGNVDTPVRDIDSSYNVLKVDNDNNEYACSICYDCIQKDIIFVETICKHIYCKPCIDRWFTMKSTCPVCMHDFNTSV
jgi:hypothetical protein